MVDLPAPFGPSRPKISPRADIEGDVVGGGEIAEALGQALRLDHRPVVLRRSSVCCASASFERPPGPPPSMSTKASSKRGGGRRELSRRRRLSRNPASLSFAGDEPDRLALDDAVDDAVFIEKLGQHLPAAPAMPDDPEDAALDARRSAPSARRKTAACPG